MMPYRTPAEEDAYQKGRRDGRQGRRPRCDAPRISSEYEWYKRGWTQGLKRSSNHAYVSPPLPSPDTEKPKEPTKSVDDLVIERYRNAKG